MPELPDVVVYVEALQSRIGGRRLERIRLASPFLLRSVEPPLDSCAGLTVERVLRAGKRIVIGLDRSLFLVLHLMIAGRLRWRAPAAPVPRKLGLAALDFDTGTLLVTEAGSKKRASLHVVQGDSALRPFHRGGLEVLGSSAEAFAQALRRENHTLKRALTDPHLFSGIGNAYSDEILHRAGLSPLALTSRLGAEEVVRLHEATIGTLEEWVTRLRSQVGDGFPEKVTAFRPEMAVHGKFGLPCPVCGARVQRIVYAENECNYCPGCQTGGRLLADRALARLLKRDWPRSLDEWDAHLDARRAG